MSDIFGFITRNFSGMPKWVRVLTFLIFVALTVYLYLCPRFVNGQIVAKNTTGGFICYRGVDLQVSIEGRLLKFKTNESGYFSVPIVSRLPERLRLQVYHEDNNEWYEVIIEAAQIWRNSDIRIEIMNKPPYIRFEQLSDSLTGLGKIERSSLFAITFGIAFAGELKIPQEVYSKSSENVNRNSIAQKTYNVISNVTGRNPSSLDENYRLSGENAPSYVERIQIIEGLEHELGVRIPDEHWQALKTAGELIDYGYKRKILENYRPDVFGPQTRDWPTMQQMMPPQERPVFNPAR